MAVARPDLKHRASAVPYVRFKRLYNYTLKLGRIVLSLTRVSSQLSAMHLKGINYFQRASRNLVVKNKSALAVYLRVTR